MYGSKASGPVIRSSPGNVSLEGKTLIFIGGTSGIGRALALEAKKAGASVYVVGRTLRDDDLKINFVQADLSLMSEAHSVANSLPFEDADGVFFTTGIVPGSKRVATTEGVELDMATSALNRHLMLKIAAPRLKEGTRVFIWGFPGSQGYMAKTKLDDFNSEKSYAGGFEAPHMNTVALNEALVYHWASKGLLVSGYNPGLITTSIRSPLLGTGCFSYFVESCVSCFNPSAEMYSKRILPLLVAPELESNNGLIFHQSGVPIKRSPEFENSETVAAWIAAADALLEKVSNREALDVTVAGEVTV